MRGGLLTAGVIVLSVLVETPAHAQAVHLADGDSFRLGYQRYRLYGIDAPELHQECTGPDGRAWPCGTRARSELRRIIGTNPVECRAVSTDRFGRAIATCTAGGRDLAEEMVRAGFATASAGYSFSNPYARAEAQARAEKKGIWAGTFEMPSDWRRSNPRDAEAEAVPPKPRDWLEQKIGQVRQTLTDWLQAVFGR